jgi:drug/metabolite transporter (DMT)-like permease
VSAIGIVAAFGTAVCWSFTAIFFSYGGRRVGSDVVNRTRLIFAFLFISIAHLLLLGVIFPFGTEPWRWGWLALSSVLGLVLGDAALFFSYVLIGPQLAMLVMAMVPIMSTFFAWIFFGEVINSTEMFGIAVAIGGVAWVVTEKRSDSAESDAARQRNYRLGLSMAFLGALGQTSNLIFSKFALLDGYSALSATQIRILIGGIVLWGMTALRRNIRPTMVKLRDRRALYAIMGGALVGPFLGIWFSLIAVQNARVGIASTIMALPPVLLIPLTFLFFGDRPTVRGVTGTVIAVIGVTMLFLLP